MSYISYKHPKMVAAESVYQFLHGVLYGAAWGAVTPIPAPGSAAALELAKSQVFKPIPPFSSLSNITGNALFFGCILGYQRFCARGMELLRRKEDYVNEVFGFAMVWPYYRYVLNYTPRRLLWHNRIVGTVLTSSVIYANLLK